VSSMEKVATKKGLICRRSSIVGVARTTEPSELVIGISRTAEQFASV
jgi:hypothetical protein